MTAEKTVWHIYHYQELFRARNVKNPRRIVKQIQYSQRPVIGWNQYSEQYLQQMAALKQRLRFDKFCMAKHVFEELLDQSNRHHFSNMYLRGYVLDERLEPADSKRIALMIGIDKKSADYLLSWLESVGLIERVAMPALKTDQELKRIEDEMRTVDDECGLDGDDGAQKSTGLKKTGKYEQVTGTGKKKTNIPGKLEKNENGNLNLKDDINGGDEAKHDTKAVNRPEGEGHGLRTDEAKAQPDLILKDLTQPDGGVRSKATLEDVARARDSIGLACRVWERLGLVVTAKDSRNSVLAAWENYWKQASEIVQDSTELLVLQNKILKAADKIRARKANGKVTYKSPSAGLMSIAQQLIGIRPKCKPK